VRLSLGKKLILSFGVILILAVIGSTISYFKLSTLIQDLDTTFQLRFPSTEAAKDLQRDINMTTVKARQAILAGSEPERREVALKLWKKTWENVEKDIVRLDQLAPKWILPENRDRLAKIKEQLTLLHDAQGKAIDHAVGSSNNVVKAGNEYTDRGTTAADALRQTIDAMSQAFEILMEKKKEEVHAASRSVKVTLAATTLSALGFGVVAAFFLVRHTSAGLKRLKEMIQDIAEGEGDVTKRLEAAGNFSNDELGEVSRLFNLFMDKLQEILRGVAAQTNKLTSASQQLLAASEQITANSGETAVQSNSVARVTKEVSQNLQGLSIGAGEMMSTIQSIAANANDAAKVATSAVGAAHTADVTVAKLDRSSTEIGEVVKVITAIAQQTNLLALNATIEAARAGEAGKGFAVVANEVKELANQTANATDNIGRKISAIQTDTKAATTAIGTVSGVIDQINAISATIATAVEEQSATTNEMTRNASEAAKGASDISISIGGVAQAAEGTSARAQESQKAAQEMASIATQLSTLMRRFKIERSERRFEIAVPVRLIAIDASGDSLEQDVKTVDVSRNGALLTALLTGVHSKLRIGSSITLARGNKRAQFLVAWVGRADGSKPAQIGVTAVDPATSFWNDVIENRSAAEISAEQNATGMLPNLISKPGSASKAAGASS
jgi:methyl-accepting chemotaxis protein